MCRYGAGFQPLSLARSGTDGSVSPEAQLASADRCPHTIRGLFPFEPGVGRVGLRSADVAVSVNGLPVHARLPHRMRPGIQRVEAGGRGLCGPAWTRGRV